MLAILLLILLAIGVAAWRAVSLAQRTPAWWAQSDPGNTDDAHRRARLLEQGLTTALHERRAPDDPWSVRMRDEDVNAWLAHRLGPWLENRALGVPDAFEPPCIRVADGRVTVGIPSPDPRVEGIFSIEFTPATSADGRLIAEDRAFAMGELPLPNPGALGSLSDELRRAARGTPIEPFMGALLDTGAALPSEITLSDQRRVRLRGVKLDKNGLIDLTLVTSRRADP